MKEGKQTVLYSTSEACPESRLAIARAALRVLISTSSPTLWAARAVSRRRVFRLRKTVAKEQQSTSKARQSTRNGTVGSAKVTNRSSARFYRGAVFFICGIGATEVPCSTDN